MIFRLHCCKKFGACETYLSSSYFMKLASVDQFCAVVEVMDVATIHANTNATFSSILEAWKYCKLLSVVAITWIPSISCCPSLVSKKCKLIAISNEAEFFNRVPKEILADCGKRFLQERSWPIALALRKN